MSDLGVTSYSITGRQEAKSFRAPLISLLLDYTEKLPLLLLYHLAFF